MTIAHLGLKGKVRLQKSRSKVEVRSVGRRSSTEVLLLTIVFRPHRPHAMRRCETIVKDVVRICVSLSVSMCAGHNRELCKNGRTARDVVHAVHLYGPKESCVE